MDSIEGHAETTWQEALYVAHADGLMLYGRSLGLSHGESEDVLQEVFVTMLGRSDPPEKPSHYLVRAFRNRAINRHRSIWRRITHEWQSLKWFEPSEEPHPGEAAAMKCLARLPAEQREAIVLKIWHGHTFEEIGGLTGVSPHTAAGRYRYGMEKLRTCLRSENSTDEESLLESRGTDGLVEASLAFPRR